MSPLLELQGEAASAAAADACMRTMQALYPLCRSITGDGVRRSLDGLETLVPLQRHEVATGEPAFDWEVPREWNIRDAWIADARGRRLVDFRAHSLHVVSYSVPVRRVMSRAELEPHLHSLPERPDWIPYRTSYYREDWGFCLRHRDRVELGDGPFEVVVDSDLRPGHLTYAECVVPGGEDEALVYTHICHPSLANDNLTGMTVAATLAQAMRAHAPRLTWRFVFAPGTIGSLVWLSRNEHCLGRIRCGLVLRLLGDDGPLVYKRSRLGGTATDRVAELVLASGEEASRVVDFEPYGYDERQFCSPGIDLPMGRLTRSPNGTYPEYHSSADNLELIRVDRLAASLRTTARLLSALDANRRLRNTSPKGEPRLGKRGLYRPTGGGSIGVAENALLWVLSLSDGQHDLAQIAARSGLRFEQIEQAAAALAAAGLAETMPEPMPARRNVE